MQSDLIHLNFLSLFSLMCFFVLFIVSNQKTVAKEPVNLSQNKAQIKNYFFIIYLQFEDMIL